MYFPIYLFLDPRESVLVIRENTQSLVSENLQNQLNLITTAALNRLNVRNTSPLFARYLDFSEEVSLKEHQWEVFVEGTSASQCTALQCMIKLVQFFETSGRNRFPTLFETEEAEGSHAIQTTLHILHKLLQKSKFSKNLSAPTQPTSSLFGKRKNQPSSSSTTDSYTHTKKQRLLAAFKSAIQKEPSSGEAQRSSILSSTPINLFTATQEDIAASDEEEEPLKTPIPSVDPHREAANALLMLTSKPIPIDPSIVTTTPVEATASKSVKKDNRVKRSNKPLSLYNIPFFYLLDMKGSSCSQTVYLGYKTIMLSTSNPSKRNLKELFTKQSSYLSIALSPSNILKWKEPFSPCSEAKHLERKEGLLRILQGIQATHDYFLSELHDLEECLQKIISEITDQLSADIALLKKTLQSLDFSEDLSQKHVSKITPLIPAEVLKRLAANPRKEIKSKKSSSLIFTYIFSVAQEGGLTDADGNPLYRISYTLLRNKDNKKLANNARDNLRRTLELTLAFLQEMPSTIGFIDPISGIRTLMQDPQTLRQILLEGLLENRLCFNKYAWHLIHHQSDSSLSELLDNTIDRIKEQCKKLPKAKISSSILCSLIASNPENNWTPLFNPTLKSVQTTPSETSPLSKEMKDKETLLTTSSSSEISADVILPLFAIHKRKTTRSHVYKLNYMHKHTRVDITNLKSKTRRFITTSLNLYEEIRDHVEPSNSLFIEWTPPYTNCSIGISKDIAMSLILRGFELTFNYYSNNYTDTLKYARGNLLEKLAITISDVKQQPQASSLLPDFTVKNTLMEDLIKQKRATLLRAITSIKKPNPSTASTHLLYNFLVHGIGPKRPDGLSHKYNISYVPRSSKIQAAIYTKTREIIISSAKNALALLQLKELSLINISFKSTKDAHEQAINSIEELRNILLQGFEETKLFFKKYATNVFETTHGLNVVQAIDEVIEEALRHYPPDSPPIRRTSPSTLERLVGSHLSQYTNEPLSQPPTQDSEDSDFDMDQQ